jgi:DNA-binding LacI/PurR family transcriptional regulator
MPEKQPDKISSRRGAATPYREIAARFSKMISDGVWQKGMALPPYRTLALDYKSTNKTIRLALIILAKDRKISLTSKHQWVVNHPEKTIGYNSNCIALISTEPHLLRDLPPIFKGMARMIHKYKKQFHIIIRDWHNRDICKVVIPDIKDQAPLGIILHGRFTQKCVEQYRTLGIPLVLADTPSNDKRIATVTVDNKAAAKDAVLRMAQLGHRHIAFCRHIVMSTGEIDPDSAERQLGYLEGLKELGDKTGSASIYNFLYLEKGSDINGPSLKALFNARPRYTAALAVDGGIAQFLAKAPQAQKLSLPRDFSLVCFGSIDTPSHFAGPRSDFERIGTESVELLESRAIRQIRISPLWHEGTTLVEVNRKLL